MAAGRAAQSVISDLSNEGVIVETFHVLALHFSCDAAELSRKVVEAAGLATMCHENSVEVRVVEILQRGESFSGSLTEALVSAARREISMLTDCQECGAIAVLGEPCYFGMAAGGAGGMWSFDEVVRFWREVSSRWFRELCFFLLLGISDIFLFVGWLLSCKHRLIFFF